MKIFSASLAFLLSLPAAAQWSQVNNGLSTLVYGAATHGTTPTHVFARAYNVLYRSNDHGGTWTPVANPIAGNPSDIGYHFNGRYFAGSSSITACIHFTDNEGDTWTSAPGAPTATVVRGFFEYGGGLYAYTSTAGIYRTVDGNSWTAVNNGLTNLNVIGMASSGPYFIAATIGGGVYRTINAASWTQSTGIGAGDLNGENVWRMGSYLYYSAQGGAAYRSSDYGETWTAWTQPAFFGLGMVEVKRFGTTLYLESRHFAGGQRDSLYRSTNEGASWTNITGNLNAADIHGSGILQHDGYVFIGYNMSSAGQGLYRYALSTGVEDAQAGMAQVASVYPNPAVDEVVLQLPESMVSATYSLIDAVGHVVATGRAMAGVQRLSLAVLSPGYYIIRWDDARLLPLRIVKRG
ncbi:MAG: hypothetical protein IPM46_07910 [Flavobacteriales bacterium]|nr:hypothetical protein [Flavobacteriales bacterium]